MASPVGSDDRSSSSDEDISPPVQKGEDMATQSAVSDPLSTEIGSVEASARCVERRTVQIGGETSRTDFQ